MLSLELQLSVQDQLPHLTCSDEHCIYSVRQNSVLPEIMKLCTAAESLIAQAPPVPDVDRENVEFVIFMRAAKVGTLHLHRIASRLLP